jgi:hypothetical protein
MAQSPAGDVQVPLSSGWTENASLLLLFVAELPCDGDATSSRDVPGGPHS